MNHVYILTDAEKRLIDREREAVERRRLLHEKQAACDHNWVCTGHSHNDDAYDCRKCGATKFM